MTTPMPLTPEQAQVIEKEAEGKAKEYAEGAMQMNQYCSEDEMKADAATYYEGYTDAATKYLPNLERMGLLLMEKDEIIESRDNEIARLISLIEVAYTVGGINRGKRKNVGNWDTFKQQQNL